jgi:beta-glucosidase/6-phospho-beta-glucosidase/beta-galactosidase
MSSPAPSATRLEVDNGFVIGSGIECSAPVIAGGHRQDELVKTGHWTRFAEDLSLVAAFGIRYLRYGIPFHVVDRDPGRSDWAWTDRALGTLRDAGLEPIADLLHFGVPDDLAGIGDPRLPARYLAYATAFAQRYPWVRYYTPVNEPAVTASFSANLGWWNERARDERSWVRAIDNVATCAASAMEAIRVHRPDAVFLQSDACESFSPEGDGAVEAASFLFERQFVGWDLVYGRRPPDAVVEWLAQGGLDEGRLGWFAEHGSSGGCIVGHDYYANEWLVDSTGRKEPLTPRRGYAAVAREHHARMGLPFMLAETNWEGTAAPAWLARTWNDALQLRDEGLPIRGYTWYGFVDHVDWDTALREENNRPNACGLVDLDRRPHAVGEQFRALAMAALRGELRPLPIPADASRATYQSGIPAFVEDVASRTAVGPLETGA